MVSTLMKHSSRIILLQLRYILIWAPPTFISVQTLDSFYDRKLQKYLFFLFLNEKVDILISSLKNDRFQVSFKLKI